MLNDVIYLNFKISNIITLYVNNFLLFNVNKKRFIKLTKVIIEIIIIKNLSEVN